MRLPQRRSQLLKKQDDDANVYLTHDGLERLKNTLEHLKRDERPKIVEDLSHALKLGDFSENAEYQDAKGKLARIDGRIFSLQDRIRRAVIIDTTSERDVITIGTTVVLDVDGVQKTYTIVGPQETNPLRGRISHLSPIGSALLGHRAGDTVRIKTDAGEKVYCVLRLETS